MKLAPASTERLQQMDDFLKEYRFYAKLLRLDRYEREFFRSSQDTQSTNEEPLARARMYEIRHFLMSLPNSDEKLLLYYHYVKGEPIERCASLLGIGRSSAFRMKTRALRIATELFDHR